MRKFLAVAVLPICFATIVSAQKYRYGQAPKPIGSAIQAHIYASHIRYACDTNLFVRPQYECGPVLDIDALLDGEKAELMGPLNIEDHDLSVIMPGDYEATLTKDDESKDRTAVHQEYNLKLPDGTIWHGVLIGVSE